MHNLFLDENHQDKYNPIDVEKEILILYAVVNDFLSDIDVSDIRKFEAEFLEYADTHYRDLLKEIVEVGALTDEIKVKMENSILEFKKIFLQNA